MNPISFIAAKYNSNCSRSWAVEGQSAVLSRLWREDDGLSSFSKPRQDRHLNLIRHKWSRWS